jgi:hypothetical protein
MHCLKTWKWQYFADEKEQVKNGLKQHPSYWKSKEHQDLLQCALEETDRRRCMRRSVARIIHGRHFDNCDLLPLIIEYLQYKIDYILELKYNFCKKKDGPKVEINM